MPQPSESESTVIESGGPAEEPVTTIDTSSSPENLHSPSGTHVDEYIQTRLAEELNAAVDDADPVAGLDRAIEDIASELSRMPISDSNTFDPADSQSSIADAIGVLVDIALEMDDPVAALEEGIDTLADALAARDAAMQAQQQAITAQYLDHQAAYQYARFHRVGELVDLGYGLDEAVAITNTDEARIQARAKANGRHPMESIYRYAMLNGYVGN